MLFSMTDESPVWKGSSSQWLNLGPFTAALIASAAIGVGAIFFPPGVIALVLPLGYIIWRFLLVRSRVFELTSERIRVTTGIINQKVDEIELYRVKDTQTFRTWWMRLTGLASIHLQTSDLSTPDLVIPAISGGVEFREQLRHLVEAERDRKRVRETDIDNMGADAIRLG